MTFGMLCLFPRFFLLAVTCFSPFFPVGRGQQVNQQFAEGLSLAHCETGDSTWCVGERFQFWFRGFLVSGF